MQSLTYSRINSRFHEAIYMREYKVSKEHRFCGAFEIDSFSILEIPIEHKEDFGELNLRERNI